METKTIKCWCGNWYHIFSHYVGDQSRCKECRERIEAQIEEQETRYQEKR